MLDLQSRGWKKINAPGNLPTVPQSALWRKGWEPFCVELELWTTGEIRGRLCAPGMKVHGNMIFESLPSIEAAVDFLESLLDGANTAVPPGQAQKDDK